MTKTKPQEAKEVVSSAKALLLAFTTALSIIAGLVMYIVEANNGPIEKISTQLEKLNDNLVQHIIITNDRIVRLESDDENMERRITLLEGR